ncbi:hypothetical protein QJU23_10070 [Pasteurella atlantica]|uniref:Uncharacterized protein n=2 Tax=Pasteurellaceae TaxID=712 RepID=A0ACC6HPE8_9PAST|nr:hypothetical protein [Pasteurella atlantica]MDP8052756.1 hypothetical protein [Pasteurella atlantica]MDP8106053.1 hypothetical protein [Pasteurella atlantica]MDP8149440.1 hypothetical protein [Pasteurella atlantica]
MKKSSLSQVIIISVLVAGCTSTLNSTSTDKQTLCKKYEMGVERAFNFGVNNFYKGYVIPNNYKGAVAQLFLIEEGLKGMAVGSFAREYKKVEIFYNKTVAEAKSEGCDISHYPLSPVNAFRKGIQILKKKNNEKN